MENEFVIGGYAWHFRNEGWNSEVVSGRIVAVGPEVVTIQESRYDRLQAFWKKDIRPGAPPEGRAGESGMEYCGRASDLFYRNRDVAKVQAEAKRLGLTVK